MEKLMQTVKFIKYTSLYDQELTLYGLEFDGVERFIDLVKFIEVTSDFKRATMVRADSVKAIGVIHKEF